ncbi:MAG TPA: ribonuclease HII [Elusimicrobia bacterium]|nr:ribonuclease HII [Elusimicrobiota bacterium]
MEAYDTETRRRLGASSLIGIDEAGRGPLAGPVVAAAVLLPSRPLPELAGVKDSKKLTPKGRERVFPLIRRAARVGVGWALPEEIDQVNILQATFLAMRRALERLRLAPEEAPWVLVDGNQAVPGLALRQKTLVGGDDLSLSIASASVVAKVVRDRWMRVLESRYPGYGFAKSKGYGSAEHMDALGRLGPSPVHRRSFHPVSGMVRV